MKRVRIFLGAAAMVVSVGAFFAFKANSKAGEGNLFHVSGTCVIDTKCAGGGTSDACPNGPHFSDNLCKDKVLDTEVVPQ
jgi:hypothetical protein